MSIEWSDVKGRTEYNIPLIGESRNPKGRLGKRGIKILLFMHVNQGPKST